MLSAVFILNKEGIVIIEKQYKEKIDRSAIEKACLEIAAMYEIDPISKYKGFIIIAQQYNDIWMLGVSEGEDFLMTPISQLHHIHKLLSETLEEVNEATIKDCYPTVYQILDLAVDYGFMFLDEQNAIETVLRREPSNKDKPGQNRIKFDLEHPWRRVGCSTYSNKLLIDQIEEIDARITQNEVTDFYQVRGRLDVKSELSDDPNCKIVLKPHTMEDVTFHRCIDVEMPDACILPFKPPDGSFTAMTYRTTVASQVMPIRIVPKFEWNDSMLRFTITAIPSSSIPKCIDFLEIKFEVFGAKASGGLTATEGKASGTAVGKSYFIEWRVDNYWKKDPISFTGTIIGAEKQPVSLSANFQIPSLALSGLSIDHLEIADVDYRFFKGSKLTTLSGDVEIRT